MSLGRKLLELTAYSLEITRFEYLIIYNFLTFYSIEIMHHFIFRSKVDKYFILIVGRKVFNPMILGKFISEGGSYYGN